MNRAGVVASVEAVSASHNGLKTDAPFSIWKAEASTQYPHPRPQRETAQRPPLEPAFPAGALGGDSAVRTSPRQVLTPRPLRRPAASPSLSGWKWMRRPNAGRCLKKLGA